MVLEVVLFFLPLSAGHGDPGSCPGTPNGERRWLLYILQFMPFQKLWEYKTFTTQHVAHHITHISDLAFSLLFIFVVPFPHFTQHPIFTISTTNHRVHLLSEVPIGATIGLVASRAVTRLRHWEAVCIYLKVKIDGDSRYQKVGHRKGTETKPICRDG